MVRKITRLLLFFRLISAWHYQEKIYSEPSSYTTLKAQPNQNDSNISSNISSHHQSPYPDSTSHLIHGSSSSHQANSNELSTTGTYHSNYGYRATESASVSSTEPDYVVNSSVISSNQTNSTLSSITNSTGLHQRRGSLQLWQFLVALLDEPAAR